MKVEGNWGWGRWVFLVKIYCVFGRCGCVFGVKTGLDGCLDGCLGWCLDIFCNIMCLSTVKVGVYDLDGCWFLLFKWVFFWYFAV